MKGQEFHRVNEADLKRMCISAGLPFPEEEIDRLIKTCPKDEEGKVAFEDFIVHLEKSPMDLMSRGAAADNIDNETNEMLGVYKRENEELKSTISILMNKLDSVAPSVPSQDDRNTDLRPPQVPPITQAQAPQRAQGNRSISNVFPEIPSKDVLPQIQMDMFGQAHQEPKVYGRRKFKEVNPPTEDIFGNKINCDSALTQQPKPSAPETRPPPQIDDYLMENIRACMDRNNKRALADVTSTIERWNGGSTMTRRMLTKIIKHSGLRLPNETVRILFDKLDVFQDGTVDLADFFGVFNAAENSKRQYCGEDPGQISRTRRAEMQNRAAPWATF